MPSALPAEAELSPVSVAPIFSVVLATAPLLIGATLTGDNLAVPGAADGSFNVTILYQ